MQAVVSGGTRLEEHDLADVNPRRKYTGFFGPRATTMNAEYLHHQEEVFRTKTNTDYCTVFFGNGLYRNKGDGTFEETSGKANAETFWPWGIAAGDFDSDPAMKALELGWARPD